MIIINPFPGQEEENAEFLEKNNAAVWLRPEDDIKQVLESLVVDPSKLVKMAENSRQLAKRNSTKDICRILFKN